MAPKSIIQNSKSLYLTRVETISFAQRRKILKSFSVMFFPLTQNIIHSNSVSKQAYYKKKCDVKRLTILYLGKDSAFDIDY